MTIDQFHVACRIRDTAKTLAKEAADAGLSSLAYLLEMTMLEADGADTPERCDRRGRRSAAPRLN